MEAFNDHPKSPPSGGVWLLVLLLAAACLTSCGRGDSQSDSSYITAPVERGRLVARVTATGTLSALVTVEVGSQVSGRIQELFADFNTPVKKGQLIARIDPHLFQAAVDQARANLLAAQGNLTKARADAKDAERKLVRARALEAEHVTSRSDLDTAQATAESTQGQVAAAEGALAQTRAALKQAEINLNYTNIVSPTDGVVISRNVDVGQTVAASLQAPTLFVIAENLTKMQVDTNVAEADVGRIRSGMKATFTVDAYPREEFTGLVRQVRNAPQTLQNVVTYDAVIDVANDGLRLKPGMTANVTFVYAERENALQVPNAALRFRPPKEQGASSGAGPAHSDHRAVWVLRGGKPVRVPIRTGVTDGSHTEVTEGDLHAGDPVITDFQGSGPGEGAQRMHMRGVF
jgi:HlyD family secretion protein